jgi:hypothetical protein
VRKNVLFAPRSRHLREIAAIQVDDEEVAVAFVGESKEGYPSIIRGNRRINNLPLPM